jgi:hypothetical protein
MHCIAVVVHSLYFFFFRVSVCECCLMISVTEFFQAVCSVKYIFAWDCLYHSTANMFYPPSIHCLCHSYLDIPCQPNLGYEQNN